MGYVPHINVFDPFFLLQQKIHNFRTQTEEYHGEVRLDVNGHDYARHSRATRVHGRGTHGRMVGMTSIKVEFVAFTAHGLNGVH